MRFNGTKGEWERNGYPRECVTSYEGEICLVNPNMGEVEHVANCKLIAAAPDLLKELIEIMEACKGNAKESSGLHKKAYTEIYEAAKVVINKALKS